MHEPATPDALIMPRNQHHNAPGVDRSAAAGRTTRRTPESRHRGPSAATAEAPRPTTIEVPSANSLKRSSALAKCVASATENSK
jgi:hypothetical protein